ncbi:MAG: hypothetical protein U0O22_07940 [Acutalibacteraceae bacterium]
MKGILFTLKKNKKSYTTKSTQIIQKREFIYFFRRYGISTLLGCSLLVGLVLGAISAGNADKQLIENLDFIFTSNFNSRCTQTPVYTFISALTANFIFFISIFLLGLSAWGSIGIPAIISFKGFGMGITGGYLYKCCGLMGVGFFLLVMLVGCVVSTLALLNQGKNCISFSAVIFSKIKGNSCGTGNSFYKYITDNSFMLIALAIGAMCDAILNSLFANIFTFS